MIFGGIVGASGLGTRTVVAVMAAGLSAGAVVGSAAGASATQVARAGASSDPGAGSVAVSRVAAQRRAVPGRPGRPSAVATGRTGEVALAWKAAKSGGKVTYEILVRPGGTKIVTTRTSRTIRGLADGTAYAFTVRAVVQRAKSAWSLSGSATPYVALRAPSRLSVGGTPAGRGTYYGNYSLTWCPPSGGTYPVDHYEYRVDGGPWQTGTQAYLYGDSSCAWQEATGELHAFGTHRYTVRAVDTRGHKGRAAKVNQQLTPTTVDLVAVATAPSGSCSSDCWTVHAVIHNGYYPDNTSVTVTINDTDTCYAYSLSPLDNGDHVLTNSTCVLHSGDEVVGEMSTLFGETVASPPILVG